MLKKLSAFGFLLATLLAASFANAGLITDVVEIDERVSVFSSYSYSHNLNDNDFILGTAESASLAIEIYDDDACNWAGCVDEKFFPEIMTVVIEKLDFDTGGITFGNFFGELEIEALVALNSDGILNVKVKGLGDFMMGDSTLSVITSSVPEPGTIGLLLMGMFGLGLARRKAKS